MVVFFGWVGVVALLLVVPLNILSNTLTPKVQAWWATTSSRRLTRRLERLVSVVNDIPHLRSAVSRQENSLAGMRFLVLVLLLMNCLIFLVVSDVMILSASFDHVIPIFPSVVRLTISAVAFYRFRAIYLFVLVASIAYYLNRAFRCFVQSSRYYAERKLDAAKKELDELSKYRVDNFKPTPLDKPESIS